MFENRTVYLEGAFIPASEAVLPIMSHSVGRGSSIFDVLSFGRTKEGRAIFRLDEHVARFLRSALALEMAVPLAAAELQEAIKETVRRNTLQAGAIKIVGFYPDPSFSLLPPGKPLHLAIFVFDPVEDFGERPLAENEGVTAFVSRWRRLDPRTVPIEAKAAANYLNGIVARTEAKNLGFDYAIMLDLEGNIAEGGTESIFLVRQGRLLTPNIGNILQGITRKSILAAAEGIGIETFSGSLKEELLGDADEIFFAGTIHPVLPVSRVGNRTLPGAPGPVTQQLSARMQEIASGRAPGFQNWLFSVCK